MLDNTFVSFYGWIGILTTITQHGFVFLIVIYKSYATRQATAARMNDGA